MKYRRTVAIHDGAFHADEVSACALLTLFDQIDQDQILRTRETDVIEACEFVCDVGGVYAPDKKLFDHHQATYQGDLSSAGMVLKYLKDSKQITSEEFTFFNNSIIRGVDAHDNGRSTQELGLCSFSHVIANFNPPVYTTDPEVLNKAFFRAFHFALGHFKRLHGRFLYNFECRKIVAMSMARGKICLFFEESIPWLESFFALEGRHHPALFVIMPSGDQWKLRGIPPDYAHRMQVRLPLPEKWAGLLGEELRKASGIDGAVFCHKGRFTSVWETREAAITALKTILKGQDITYEDAL